MIDSQESDSSLYFAYGSNMLSKRLIGHIPEASVYGYAKVKNKRLVFNKISIDTSGKANLIDCLNSEVRGVLYKIKTIDLLVLDRVEMGYERKLIDVWLNDGTHQIASTYISIKVDDSLKPFQRYKQYVVDGAKEYNFPQDYIDFLNNFDAIPDPCQI